ncbi:hypothetical protein ACWGJW_39650 [Streptomyces nigrescens]
MPVAPWALMPGSLYYTPVTRERESKTIRLPGGASHRPGDSQTSPPEQPPATTLHHCTGLSTHRSPAQALAPPPPQGAPDVAPARRPGGIPYDGRLG